MLALKDLIQSHEWCLLTFHDDFEDETFVFQIRFIRFDEINFDDVDDFDEVEDVDVNQNLHILAFEIVNLNKKKYDSDALKEKLVIVDEEGYQYNFVEDSHLCSYSEYAKRNNLSTLYSVKLPPKIPRAAALIYELPEFFETLYLSAEDGSLEIVN